MVAETFDEYDTSAVEDAINDSLAETLEEPVGVLEATPDCDGIEADGTALVLAVAEENAVLVTTLEAVIKDVADDIAVRDRDAREVSEANASPDSTDDDEDVRDEIDDGDDDRLLIDDTVGLEVSEDEKVTTCVEDIAADNVRGELEGERVA